MPVDEMAKTPYIALADDDTDDQEMLAERFIERFPGTVFKFFKDGQEIVDFLEACPAAGFPVLLLLDYKMPIMTGAEVLKILHRDRRYDAIHKFVWSTSGNNEYVDVCVQNGAEKYFTKPNNIPQLDGIITELSLIIRSAK